MVDLSYLLFIASVAIVLNPLISMVGLLPFLNRTA